MAKKNAVFDRYTSPLEVGAMTSFIVSYFFRERHPSDASSGVRIIRITEVFAAELLPLVEQSIPAGLISRGRLVSSATNQAILDAIGSSRRTYLADLWRLLALQPNGEQGRLPVNGRVSIIYVTSVSKTLMAAYARWYKDEGGWGVGCLRLKPNISAWEAGDVVLHR